MNLNDIDIKLASRTNSQAINLGFVTARRYQKPLLMTSFLAVLPVFVIAVFLALWMDWYTFASLLLWWCKPYYDRVILYNASRLVFRQPIGFFEIVESLTKATKNGLWLHLTFYRFAPARSLTLPIKLLEGLWGKDYSQRVKVVCRGSSSSGTALTWGLWHIEAILYLNIFLFILMIIPDNMKAEISEWFIATQFKGKTLDYRWLEVVMLMFQSMTMIIVEVFYVMGGFMLYLNSRIKMEGWDIELGLKQMAMRLSNVSAKFMSTVVVIFVALISLNLPDMARANNAASSPVTINANEDKQILKDLLLDDDLNPYEVKTTWEPKNKKTSDKKEIDTDFDVGKADKVFEVIATVVKILLILLALWLIYWVIVNREKVMGLFNKNPTADELERPTVMFGLNVTRESLPDNIPTEAKRLLHAGDVLGALSLLYRGSLTSLINDYAIDIQESDTEGDCLRASEPRVNEKTYEYFKRLTNTWQRLVYAHQQPNSASVDILINDWGQAFFAHDAAVASVEDKDE